MKTYVIPDPPTSKRTKRNKSPINPRTTCANFTSFRAGFCWPKTSTSIFSTFFSDSEKQLYSQKSFKTQIVLITNIGEVLLELIQLKLHDLHAHKQTNANGGKGSVEKSARILNSDFFFASFLFVVLNEKMEGRRSDREAGVG